MNPARAHALLLLIACLIALGGGARRAHADNAPLLMSSEEAAVQLQPYIFTDSTAPTGYSTALMFFLSPVLNAFPCDGCADQGSPTSLLESYEQQGSVLEMHQTLLQRDARVAVAALPQSADFVIFVMRSDADAQAVVDAAAIPNESPQTTRQTLTGQSELGDASTLYALSKSYGQQGLEVRWRRGATAFTLSADADSSDPTGLIGLATTIDALESAHPAIDLSAPRVIPPVTELQRLQALIRMQTINVPTTAVPGRFRGVTLMFPATPDQAIATASDPAQVLDYLDTKWQRIASLTQIYTSADYATTDSVRFIEDASAEAAAVNLRDNVPGANAAPFETSPVALGDDAWLRHGRTTDGAGTPQDYAALGWRHGAVILAVEVNGTPGSVMDGDVAALAQVVDAAYQHSAYVSVAATNPPSSSPMPSDAEHAIRDFRPASTRR